MLKTCKFYSGSVGCNTLVYIIHCGKARQPWFGPKGDMTEYSIRTISDSSGAILLALDELSDQEMALALGHSITLISPLESLRKLSLNINIPHGRFND